MLDERSSCTWPNSQIFCLTSRSDSGLTMVDRLARALQIHWTSPFEIMWQNEVNSWICFSLFKVVCSPSNFPSKSVIKSLTTTEPLTVFPSCCTFFRCFHKVAYSVSVFCRDYERPSTTINDYRETRLICWSSRAAEGEDRQYRIGFYFSDLKRPSLWWSLTVAEDYKGLQRPSMTKWKACFKYIHYPETTWYSREASSSLLRMHVKGSVGHTPVDTPWFELAVMCL